MRKGDPKKDEIEGNQEKENVLVSAF